MIQRMCDICGQAIPNMDINASSINLTTIEFKKAEFVHTNYDFCPNCSKYMIEKIKAAIQKRKQDLTDMVNSLDADDMYHSADSRNDRCPLYSKEEGVAKKDVWYVYTRNIRESSNPTYTKWDLQQDAYKEFERCKKSLEPGYETSLYKNERLIDTVSKRYK